jgi:predicted small lipoprotein YifL
MKKLLALLLCGAMAVSMLTACGSKEPEEAPVETTAEEIIIEN